MCIDQWARACKHAPYGGPNVKRKYPAQIARTPQDKTVIQRQIAATDRQIDRLVYELYGLSEKEIKVVEEATSKVEG